MPSATIIFDDGELADLLQGPDGPVYKMILKTVIRIEGVAKSLCPVDTGRLRSSIQHQIALDAGEITGRVGTNVEYAPYVEFGTRKWVGKPFLIPALYTVVGSGSP